MEVVGHILAVELLGLCQAFAFTWDGVHGCGLVRILAVAQGVVLFEDVPGPGWEFVGSVVRFATCSVSQPATATS